MPPSSNIVVISDVHGRADLLRTMIAQARQQYGSDVTLFHTGDLIDKGPNSKNVVQLCIDNDIQGVLGNHELWLHQFLNTGQFDSFALHKMMQGDATLRSYGITSKSPGEIEDQLKWAIPKPHQEYILGLPVWLKIEIGGQVYRLNHAGLKHDTAMGFLDGHPQLDGDTLMNMVGEATPASILWTSNSFKNPAFSLFSDGSIQIFGHSPVPGGNPIITPHWIALGCGTRPAHILSGIALPSQTPIFVDVLTKHMSSDENYHHFSLD